MNSELFFESVKHSQFSRLRFSDSVSYTHLDVYKRQVAHYYKKIIPISAINFYNSESDRFS